VIGLTGGGATHPQHASLAALIAVEGAIFATGAALVRISTRRLVLRRAEGLLLGAAAGALFGVSDVAIKYLTQTPAGPLLGALSPWTLTALVAGVIAFYASARSLQIGQGVEVALTSVAANLAAIIGGVLVFHDRLRRPGHHWTPSRVLLRDRRRGTHARPDARHPRHGLTRRAAHPVTPRAPGSTKNANRRVLQRSRGDHKDAEDLVIAEDGRDAVSDPARPVCTRQTTLAFVRQRARALRWRQARPGRPPGVSCA
jgi:hypothetical protein